MVDRKDHVERRLAESFVPLLRKQEVRRDEQRKCDKAGGHHRAISRRTPGARPVRFSDAVARVDAESHYNRASSPVLRPAQRPPPGCSCPSLDGTGNRPVSGRMADAQLSAVVRHNATRTRPIAIKYKRAPGSPRAWQTDPREIPSHPRKVGQRLVPWSGRLRPIEQ
jgi:hypothetical protein